MHVLVTGGSGFLGSELVKHLVSLNYQVTVLLRSASSEKRLSSLLGKVAVKRFESFDQLQMIVSDVQPDAVVHTVCSYGRKDESPEQIIQANIMMGIGLLQASVAVGVSKFINTDTVLDRMVSPYALSKKQFSEWGQWFSKMHQLHFVNVLLQHMYGAGDDTSKFTTHVIKVCHHHEPELKLTLGEQKRDFIYIADVVTAYECLLRKSELLSAGYVDVEVGSGVAPAVREYVEMVHQLTHSKTVLEFGAFEYRPNEPMYCCADISLIESLGWGPRYTLQQGLRETIAHEYCS